MESFVLNGVIVRNGFDELCNWCIKVMEEMSSMLGVTYGELNVWLFVIIQPALILLFMTTTVILTVRLYRKNKDFRRGNLITAAISTVIILAFTAIVLIAARMVFSMLAATATTSGSSF